MFDVPLPSGSSPHLRRAGSRPTFTDQGRMKINLKPTRFLSNLHGISCACLTFDLARFSSK